MILVILVMLVLLTPYISTWKNYCHDLWFLFKSNGTVILYFHTMLFIVFHRGVFYLETGVLVYK